MGSVADANEVLEFLSSVMRGELDGATARMKAAELLGKRLGAFNTEVTAAEAAGPVVLVDDIAPVP